MTPPLTTREASLAAAVAALGLLALFGPALEQPTHYQAFADPRTFAGIPRALDVLSNLAFALWGLIGLWQLGRLPENTIPAAQSLGARMFFRGLIATAIGSAWYHWQPGDAGLVVDRLCMVWAFAGLALATVVALAAGLVRRHSRALG